MALSPEYKQRLSDWVVSEIERAKLSERKLAEKIGVTYNALQTWRKQKIRQGLTEESIAAIARYRRETPAEVHAWLNGSLPPTHHNPLVRAVREASIGDLIVALSIGLRRLEGAIGGIMSGNSIAELVRLEMQIKGLDPDKDEDFREFARLALAVEEQDFQHLRGILNGTEFPTRNDLPAIATGLYLLTGKPYSSEDLMRLGHENGDRGGLDCQV